MWAKLGRGIWGLGHVFEGKLYFTKDIVDDSLVFLGERVQDVLVL